MKYRIAIGSMANKEWKFVRYAFAEEIGSLRVNRYGYVELLVKEHFGDMWEDVSSTHKAEWGCTHNGIDLYENDIVTSPNYPLQDNGEYNYHGVIYYDKSSHCFGLCYALVNPKKAGISDGVGNMLCDYGNLVLLGNLNENPELLTIGSKE